MNSKVSLVLLSFLICTSFDSRGRECPTSKDLNPSKVSNPVINGAGSYGIRIESSCIKGSSQMAGEIWVKDAAVTGGSYEGIEVGNRPALPSTIFSSHQSGASTFKGHWNVHADTKGISIDGNLDCYGPFMTCVSADIVSGARVDEGVILKGQVFIEGHVGSGVIIEGSNPPGTALCSSGVSATGSVTGSSRIRGCVGVDGGNIVDTQIDGWIGLFNSDVTGGSIMGYGTIRESSLTSPSIDSSFFRIEHLVFSSLAFSLPNVQLCYFVPLEITAGYTNCFKTLRHLPPSLVELP